MKVLVKDGELLVDFTVPPRVVEHVERDLPELSGASKATLASCCRSCGNPPAMCGLRACRDAHRDPAPRAPDTLGGCTPHADRIGAESARAAERRRPTEHDRHGEDDT